MWKNTCFAYAAAGHQSSDPDLSRMTSNLCKNACCRMYCSECVYWIHNRYTVTNTEPKQHKWPRSVRKVVKPNNVRLLNGCGYRTKGSPWYDVTRGSGALEYRAKINSGHNVHLSQVITSWWLKSCYKVQPGLHFPLSTAGARTITA